ncbi:MAG: hypothetical protein OQJ97_09140 [Rhodospirillales bacterium]|nr:hypothetical protein [Rhodospirillales bacterium]
MSAPVVPPPLPPTTAPSLPLSAAVATVPKPPPAILAQLQLSTIFSGTVDASIPGKGIFEVDTQFGKLQIQTLMNLKAGTKLGFQVQGLAPKLTLLITDLNGKPLQQGAATWNRTAVNLGAQAKTDTIQTTQMGTNANKGAPILATVMRGTPVIGQGTKGQNVMQQGQGTAQAGLQNQSPGTPGKGTVLPQGGTLQSGAPQAPATPQTPIGQPQAQAALQALLAGKGKALPPGMQMQVRISNVSQPTSETGSQASSLAGQTKSTTVPTTQGAPASSTSAVPTLLNGQVTGSTPQGQTLVQTPLGLLALETKAPLSVGSRITLEISAQQVLQKAAAPLQQGQGQNLFLPRLGEALEVLNEFSPGLARQVISSTIPRPDAALGNTMVFFLTALRVGTFRNLIGESAFRILDSKGKAGLAGRVGEDFKASIKTVNDPLTGDWRVALVPLLQGNQLGDLRISFREQGHENSKGDEKDKEGTRFIIDVALERFGRIQFDGLAKEKKKHFDLIIRTEEAMPANIRKDINGIFTKSCEAQGITAQLVFQVTPKFIEIGGVELDKDHLGLIV